MHESGGDEHVICTVRERDLRMCVRISSDFPHVNFLPVVENGNMGHPSLFVVGSLYLHAVVSLAVRLCGRYPLPFGLR